MTEPDDALVQALHRAGEAGAGPDVEDALTLVRSRSRVVKRRRAAARTVAAAGALVVVVAIWMASRPMGEARVDTVSSPTAPTTPTTIATSTSAMTTSSATTSTSTTTTTTTTTSSPAVGLAPTPTAAAPPASGGSARTAPASSSPGTFRGAGGVVTVRLVSDVLQLVSTQPTPGYQLTEQRVSSDKIEVRFESLAGRTKIVVTVDNGRIVSEVEEDPSSSAPGGEDGTSVEPGGGDGTRDDSGGSGADRSGPGDGSDPRRDEFGDGSAGDHSGD